VHADLVRDAGRHRGGPREERVGVAARSKIVRASYQRPRCGVLRPRSTTMRSFRERSCASRASTVCESHGTSFASGRRSASRSGAVRTTRGSARDPSASARRRSGRSSPCRVGARCPRGIPPAIRARRRRGAQHAAERAGSRPRDRRAAAGPAGRRACRA
jgi:hypothetical protein